MVKTTTTFTCEICGTTYGSHDLATRCETQPPPVQPAVKVGDFLAHGGYGWWKSSCHSWALTNATPWRGTKDGPRPLMDDAGFRPSTPEDRTDVGSASWAPIFRVVGFSPPKSFWMKRDGVTLHEPDRVVIWSPKHANRGGEDSEGGQAFGYYTNGNLRPLLKPDWWPALTDEEEDRFQQLVQGVAAGKPVPDFGSY
ncbi:hypothetical protein TMCBR3_gp043c [Caulobacter phage TMCBR3]|nr:hypothetical protein TMCBR3_gp043c [Caulobacter phage TMCBR3]